MKKIRFYIAKTQFYEEIFFADLCWLMLIRGQRSEARDQRPEIRHQRSEIRDQKAKKTKAQGRVQRQLGSSADCAV